MDEMLNDTVTLGGETVTLNHGAWVAIRVRAGKLEPDCCTPDQEINDHDSP
jgi:hypothetical protein